MNKLRLFMDRYQMGVFVLLAYLISWSSALPMQGALIPHGPMIAAFIVLAVVSGRRGVSGLWRQMTRWQVGWQWYLIAPGIILAAHAWALATSLLLGAEIANTTHLQTLPGYLGMIFPFLILGGLWEEPGWLGYALRRFQKRLAGSPVLIILATGLIRMVWHTPLLVYGKIPWYDYIFVSFALQIIFTWLYNKTQGSVLIPMIGHLFSNLMFATMYPLFSGQVQERYWILMVAAEVFIALGIVITSRGMLGVRPEPRPGLGISGN